MHSRPPHLALHHHRSSTDPNFFLKRQYGFLIVACLLAAFTIIYSTSVLLTRLPDVSSHRLFPKRAASSSPPTNPTTPAQPPPIDTRPPCNTSASPYELHLRGEAQFPDLAAFVRDRTILLEDMHPASFWVVGREGDSDNHVHAYIDWGLAQPIDALLPLPPGVLPLLTAAPHSVNCSWDQVRNHWEVAQQQQQQGEAQELHEIRMREDLANASAGLALPGMGRPQGMFYRVSLPALLEPEGQAAAAAGSTGKGGRKGTKGGAGRAGGDGAAAGRLVRQERELFYADDRFSAGERIFPMRSMTKALVALLCMALQDRGFLSVHDPVHKYLPEWRQGVYVNMTVAMLLTHTAGYDTSYTNAQVLAPGNITLRESALRSFNHSKLVGLPGAQFNYSEIGYQVLGAVAEAAGGAPFHTLMEELVLVPAGMCSTRIVNWWADNLPTRGPLIDDCITDVPLSPPSGSARGWLTWFTRSRRRQEKRKEKGRGSKDDSGKAGGGRAWALNPSVAIGGITTTNDLNRLLGLLANGGRAVCCGDAIPAPGSSPEPIESDAGATHGSAVGDADRSRLTFLNRRYGRSDTAERKSKRTSAASGSRGGRSRRSALDQRRQYCRCGGLVVSERGVKAMMTRQSLPGFEATAMVQAFYHATPLTVELLVGMGLYDTAAHQAWQAQLWGGFGYGYGMWLGRNLLTGSDHVWMFGAFNSVAGLVTLSGNSTTAALARKFAGGGAAEGGRGGGDGAGHLAGEVGGPSQGAVQVALVGASWASFNAMWVVAAGYLAL